MKHIMLFLIVIHYSGGICQNPCVPSAPKEILLIPNYQEISFKDTVYWIISDSITDDSTWYVLYHDFCCGTPLMKTKHAFLFEIHHQGRYYVRTENPCGNSSVLGVDIDLLPREEIISTTEESWFEDSSRVITDHPYQIIIASILGQIIDPQATSRSFAQLPSGHYIVMEFYQQSPPIIRQIRK